MVVAPVADPQLSLDVKGDFLRVVHRVVAESKSKSDAYLAKMMKQASARMANLRKELRSSFRLLELSEPFSCWRRL